MIVTATMIMIIIINNDHDYRKDNTYIIHILIVTICIFILLFIHNSYIYIYTRYTVHAAYNWTASSLREYFFGTETWIKKSTVLGRPKVSMDSEVKHSETGFQMDR